MPKLKKLKWWHWLIAFLVIGSIGKSLDPSWKAKKQAEQVALAKNKAASNEQLIKKYAYEISKAQVLAILKAPSTAKFTDRYQCITKPGNVYVVNAELDSQNSYGTMLRNYYRCEMEYNAGEPSDIGSWKIVSCNLINP